MTKLSISSLLLLAVILLSTNQARVKSETYHQGRRNLNLYDKPLKHCSHAPKTGYYRNGYCTSGKDDKGTHVVCAQMTKEFLKFTKKQGNDLSTPAPQYDFPGLKAGDRWCLCAYRWREAYNQGVAPLVVMEATEKQALRYAKMRVYKDKELQESGDEL